MDTAKVGHELAIDEAAWKRTRKVQMEHEPGLYMVLHDVSANVVLGEPQTRLPARSLVRPQYASDDPFGRRVQYVTVQRSGE